jgi:hypothetical protein
MDALELSRTPINEKPAEAGFYHLAQMEGFEFIT